MNTSRTRSVRGMTFVEVTIALFLLAAGLAATVTLFTRTEAVADATHVRTRVEAEHRRNILTIANVLRSAEARTLSGFVPVDPLDPYGPQIAKRPVVQRVVGADLRSLLYEEVEALEWRASNLQVPGVTNPGAIWLVSSAGARLIADRVPQGGFFVSREGRPEEVGEELTGADIVLVIHLTTYYALDRNNTVTRTGELAVTLRN